MKDSHPRTDAADGRFHTTRWSMISDVRDIQSPAARSVLNALLADYWKPVYCHIRKKGVGPEKAKDLTQDFFYSVLYEKDLFGTAKRSRGKFRSFLLTALDRYLIDRNRYENAEKRSMYRAVTNAELLDNLDLPDSYHAMNDRDCFDYAWVASLIENVSEQVRQHFCSKDKQHYWEIFEHRVKIPVIEETEPPSLSQLCDRYGVSDPVTASNMVSTVKRAFRRALRTRIREYVYTDSEVDAELSEFLNFLRKKTQDRN